MRTKKILSIVLAATIFLGIFGVLGASALPAQTGWPSQVVLVNQAGIAGRWDEAVIDWTFFTSTTGQNNGFAVQRNRGTATVTWIVYFTPVGPGGQRTRMQVHNTDPATAPGLRIFTQSTATTEQLRVRQGRNSIYGLLEVSVTVNALCTATNEPVVRTSEALHVRLVDQTGLSDLIAEANAILENENRYTDDFIRDLRALVASATHMLTLDISIPANQDRVREAQANLQAAVNRAPGQMRLWFIGSQNGSYLARLVWGTVDFFSRISDAVEPVTRLFTAFFGLFGFLTPILSILLGLFLI